MDTLNEILSKSTTTRAEMAETLIELQAPRPRELFMSDIHGEYEAFSYLLRSGCTSVRNAIDAALPNETDSYKQALVLLVCYPEEKMDYELSLAENEHAWLIETLCNLGAVLNGLANETTRFFVSEAISGEYANLLENLMYNGSLRKDCACAIVEAGCAKGVIETACEAVRALTVSHLHVVGDIYDRGPLPDEIMEELIAYPSMDIQWGNHDILWMGAALGQVGCIAHVVRICARYGNLSVLTDTYGMDLSPLVHLANTAYANDPCVAFGLKSTPAGATEEDIEECKRIQKALAYLQFKVEGKLIDENPSFGLEDRKLLHRINPETNTVVVDGIEYPLIDPVFPTVDFDDPYALTADEQTALDGLVEAFTSCEKLKRHMQLFLEAGSLYTIAGNTLLFHACVPLNEDGSLKTVELFGQSYKGRALFDAVDSFVRAAYLEEDPAARKQGLDMLWYLWLGQGSPLFAKSKMATFEIYQIEDKAARKEAKNAFYALLENDEALDGIFTDFGMNPATSRIVCGHVPVKVKDGEDPVKCNGRAIIIDGGMSRPYQKSTGIAGMTLVSDKCGVRLYTHKPFTSIDEAIKTNTGIDSSVRVIQEAKPALRMAQTEDGLMLAQTAQSFAKLASALEANGR